MERFITSINLTLGTILVLVAVAYPMLAQGLVTDVRHAKVEDVVKRIANEERTFYRNRNRFFNFTAGDFTVNFPDKTVNLATETRETGFQYEAYQESDGSLVIRAYPSREELSALWLSRPQMLTYRTNPKRHDGKFEWSNPGL